MKEQELLNWLRGFIEAVDGLPTEKQWETIKNKVSKPFGVIQPAEPITKSPFPTWQEPHKENPYKIPGTPEPYTVKYCDICSCNQKNGGSGICNCIMGNEFVPSNWKTGGVTVSTDTLVPNGFIKNTSCTAKIPDNATLTYTTGTTDFSYNKVGKKSKKKLLKG